jgi:hypothetical protein
VISGGLTLNVGRLGNGETQFTSFQPLTHKSSIMKDITQVIVCRVGFSLGIKESCRGHMVPALPDTGEKVKIRKLMEVKIIC